jgi:uncharacterized RDD family membrane protein YckC
MEAAASTCPKCGLRREPDWGECPFCGVIYAKAEARRAEPPAAAGGGGWSVAVPAAAGAGGATWGGAAPPAGTWGAPPPPPPADGEDLYRPPSAPAVSTRHHTSAALAGRGTRLAAQIVDGLFAVPLGIGVAVLEPAGPAAVDPNTEMLVILGVLLAFLVLVGINLRLLYLHGQTIGKRVLGVRIVRLDGDRASLGRIVVLRTMAPSMVSGIPLLGTLFALVNYLFIFRDDRRCVHDHMADTKVVVA